MWFIPAIISAVFSAAAAITEKKTLQQESALDFSLLLSLFAALLSLPFLLKVNWTALDPAAVLILSGKALLGAVSFLFVMRALKDLAISSALPLLTLTPGAVALAAFLVLGENLSLPEITGMLLLLAGTYVLQLEGRQSVLEPFRFLRKSRVYLFVFGAVLIFTVTSVLDKALLSRFKVQPELFLPLQNALFFLYFSIFALIKRRRKGSVPLGSALRRSWKGIVLVALFTVVYRYSHILAVKAGAVALALSVKRISVFMATVAGGRYFREEGLLRKSIATAVMVGGGVLIILKPF